MSIFQVDSLDDISPNILRNAGILKLSTDDIQWMLIMQNWLSKQPEGHKEILGALCSRYIQPTLDFLANERVILAEKTNSKSVIAYNHTRGQLRHVVCLTDLCMVKNLFAIFEVRYLHLSGSRSLSCIMHQSHFTLSLSASELWFATRILNRVATNCLRIKFKLQIFSIKRNIFFYC